MAPMHVVTVSLEAKLRIWAKNADSECFYLGPGGRVGSLEDGYDFLWLHSWNRKACQTCVLGYKFSLRVYVHQYPQGFRLSIFA